MWSRRSSGSEEVQMPVKNAIMISKFKPQQSRADLDKTKFTEQNTEQDSRHSVYFVSESYNITRHSESASTLTQQVRKYESTWLPKPVVRLTLNSGFSSATVYSTLMLASLIWYGSFIFFTVNVWDWFATYSLSGVMSLAMIFGAEAVIGILLSIIEENDSVKLVSQFFQSMGAVLLLGSSFLLGGWCSTQWLRAELIPYWGVPIATMISVFVFAFVTQQILRVFGHFYRITNGQ